ncbi:hypothetical protein ACKWTF_003424 [Chironomus riparius]
MSIFTGTWVISGILSISRIRKEISTNQQQQTRNEVRVDDGTKYMYKEKHSAVHFTPWQILHFLYLLAFWPTLHPLHSLASMNAKHFFPHLLVSDFCFERLSDGWF